MQHKKALLSRVDLHSDNQLFFRRDEVLNHLYIISYVKVTKYLRQECQGFLANVVEAQSESKEFNPSLVRVVSKFFDVFPKELSGLPLAREIVFFINLL